MHFNFRIWKTLTNDKTTQLHRKRFDIVVLSKVETTFQHRIIIFIREIEKVVELDQLTNKTLRNEKILQSTYDVCPIPRTSYILETTSIIQFFKYQSDTYGLLWFFSYRQIIFDHDNFAIERSVSDFSILSRILWMSLRILRSTTLHLCCRLKCQGDSVISTMFLARIAYCCDCHRPCC